MKYLIDSYAWIEYLDGTQEGLKVKKILNNNESYTLTLNLAEVISKTKRTGKDPKISYKAIVSNSKIISINSEIAKDGGIFHAEIHEKIKSFGLVDCLLLMTARKINAKILTGDRHFKGFKEAILLR